MPDDCISITEKTFDLSLDDTQVDSDEESESHRHVQGSFVNDDVLNNVFDIGSLRSGSQGGDTRDRTNGITRQQVSSGGAKIRSKEELKLIESLKILQKISGTDLKIDTGEDIEGLENLILELSENCLLKTQFIEKNYRFLENLYESVQNKYNYEKNKNGKLIKELEQIKSGKDQEYKIFKDIILKNTRGDEIRTGSEFNNLVQMLNSITTEDVHAKDLVIEKQAKEIKEYKRFIRELMDR